MLGAARSPTSYYVDVLPEMMRLGSVQDKGLGSCFADAMLAARSCLHWPSWLEGAVGIRKQIAFIPSSLQSRYMAAGCGRVVTRCPKRSTLWNRKSKAPKT